MDRDPNPFWIMTLVYPAILGTLLYEFLTQDLVSFSDLDLKEVLVSLLLIHYAFDFAYTVADNTKDTYGWRPFLPDMVIVGLLYGALQSARQACLLYASLFMLATKAFAMFWERLERRFEKKDPRRKGEADPRKVELASDFTPAVLYLLWLVPYFYFTNDCVKYAFLILIIIIDILLYAFHLPIKRWIKQSKRWAPKFGFPAP